MNILLLEDDVILSEIINEYLTDKGYNVDCSFDGIDAYDLVESKHYDLMVLDVNVPHLSGFELLKLLKENSINIPSIFITSLNTAEDVKEAFNIGADDYLKKPFDLIELDVRIEHLIKVHNLKSDIIALTKDIEIDPTAHTLKVKDKMLSIPKKEFDILKYFANNPNRFISQEELINNIWQTSNIPTDATIRTYIKNIRNLVGKEFISSQKGVGYRLNI
ncbi:response regulator transcription factor [Sulfurimonas sp.]|uniref:response regulator transcription factor n=1 Tax=Sulfurimonas sp. TaxID=2022749 RepID=UPI003566B83A